MQSHAMKASAGAVLLGLLWAPPASADAFSFSTGPVTNFIATATRPASSGKFEIESADDFALTQSTSITSATFTGLLTGGATTANVGRTSGPPTFSTPNVPTRVNSPSDVELVDRDTAAGNLTLTTHVVSPSFTALNSVQPGGIPIPGFTPTGGTGSVTGTEVEFDVNFTAPFDLPADHYFFVPQVEITTATGEFSWLSGTRPIPFPPVFTDLQSWTRDAMLDPDWLRVGTDIVGVGTFNEAFTLTGQTIVPEPASLALVVTGLVGLGALYCCRKKALPGRLL